MFGSSATFHEQLIKKIIILCMHVSWRKCIRFHPPVFPAVIAEGEIFPVKATGAQFVQEKMGLRSNKAETSNFINQGVVLL